MSSRRTIRYRDLGSLLEKNELWRNHGMILGDLVSSISHALPRLVAVSARRPHDQMVFGPEIGYAFVPQNRSETTDIENADTWATFQTTTFGMLGTGRTGQAVARATYQRFGADFIYHHSAA